MRFVFVCRRYCPGEAWTNRLLAYAKGLAEQGVGVCLMFLISDEKRTFYEINIPNVEVVKLWESDGYLCRKNRYLSYMKNKRQVRHFIKNGDVCCFSDASGFFMNEVKASKKRIQILFESTEHPEVLNQSFIKKLLLARYFKKLVDVDYLIVISNALKNYYISRGLLEQRIHVLNMFVDTIRFANLTKRRDDKYIGYCGSISCYKDGVDILIKSFAEFSQQYPDYILEIYGTGPKEEILKLNQLCDFYNIKEKVHFAGKVSYESMPQKLFDSTILALSRPDNQQSRYGFPTKLGEYLATGNPVVVTSVGEIPYFIKDGKNGYLATPNDVKSFTLKLLQAAGDLTNSKEVGLKGRELVFNEFSYTEQVKRLLTIIKSN